VRDLARASQCQNSVPAVGQQTASAQLIHGILSTSERFQLLQQLRLGHGGTGHWLEHLPFPPGDRLALEDIFEGVLDPGVGCLEPPADWSTLSGLFGHACLLGSRARLCPIADNPGRTRDRRLLR